jgi:hypothetical protein
MNGIVILAGGFTGLVVGLTGVGGGALLTPLLVLFFDVVPTTAVGTDLWFAAITKLVATGVHHRHGLIDWEIAKRLWLGSLTASSAALVWMRFIPPSEWTMTFLVGAIAFAVSLTAAGMLLQKPIIALDRPANGGAERFGVMQAPLTIAAGAVLGTLVTLTSVGAGALGAVLLVYLYPSRLPPARLVATDIVHAIPLAIVAGSGHLAFGNVDAGLLAYLLAGSIPAAYVGARLSSMLPYPLLRTGVALMLLFVGLRLAFTLWV